MVAKAFSFAVYPLARRYGAYYGLVTKYLVVTGCDNKAAARALADGKIAPGTRILTGRAYASEAKAIAACEKTNLMLEESAPIEIVRQQTMQQYVDAGFAKMMAAGS